MDACEHSKSLEYWNRRPCNVRHSNKEVSKEYFKEVTFKKYFVEPHIPLFAEFDSWKGSRVLEIGCGIGTDAESFARAGADYTGIDFSEKSLELAKKRFELFSLPGTFILGTAQNVSELVNGSFDLIYSFGVIHHCEGPEKVLEEIRKIAKKETKIKIMLYADPSWKKDIALQRPEAQESCAIVHYYTEDGIRKLFKDFNIQFKRTHIFPYEIESYKNGKYVKEKWFQSMPSDMFSRLETLAGHHWLIDAQPSS